jgi:hypothetical protein
MLQRSISKDLQSHMCSQGLAAPPHAVLLTPRPSGADEGVLSDDLVLAMLPPLSDLPGGSSRAGPIRAHCQIPSGQLDSADFISTVYPEMYWVWLLLR